MRKKLKAIAGLSLAGLLALSACGSPESSSGGKGDPKEKEITIGVTQIVEHPSLDAAFEGFKKAIEDNGFKNVKYDVQIAQGDMNNSQTIANNFAGDKVDLIFANSTPSAQSALNATKDIPIVFTSVTDPVGAKLVESFDKPGPNITGTTDTHPDAIPNLLKFIDEETDASNVGVIFNSGEQNSEAQMKRIREYIKETDLKLTEATISNSSEVKQATESLIGRADAIYIIKDNTVVSALESVIKVANEKDIPLFVGENDSVERGGFAAYGFSYFDLGYETGEMAAKILSGEKKAEDLPVQVPQNLKLLINKKAAKEMNIEIKPEWESKAEFIEE